MSEVSTGEIAQRVREAPKKPSALAIEVVEAVLLACVALMTAWSGYQAALWSSHSAVSYGHASSLRVSAQAAQTRAGQEMLYDAATFNQWLVAVDAGNTDLAAFLTRRFRPEYRTAFDAWLRTDPLHNPSAPTSPALVPEYRNASEDRAADLEKQATAAFDQGTHERDVSDNYIRVTVVLAIVLFLTALSQRFTIQRVRAAIVILAIAALAFAIYALATVGA
jgi:hypothetical protein